MNTFRNNPHNPPHVNAGPGGYPHGGNYNENYNDPYGQNYPQQAGQPGYFNNSNYPNYPPIWAIYITLFLS